MNSDCDLSPLLHTWEGGRLWLAHGGPTKVANNSPSPHPPYKSGKSTIFGKITCFWRKTLVPTINYVIFVTYSVSYGVSYSP